MRSLVSPSARRCLRGGGAERSAVPAFTQTQTLNNLGFGVNTTRGWAFTVSARIVVEQLGFWDEAGTAGLAEAHPIGVWSNDGTLLTSATVPAGTAAPLEGTFRWIATSPVVLQPGTTYVIGAYWTAGSLDFRLQGGTNVVFDPRVTLTDGRSVNTTGLTFPSFAGAPIELNANFKATTAPEIPALPRLGAIALVSLLLGVIVRRMLGDGGKGAWKRSATSIG
jgi:hypothetical protein